MVTCQRYYHWWLYNCQNRCASNTLYKLVSRRVFLFGIGKRIWNIEADLFKLHKKSWKLPDPWILTQRNHIFSFAIMFLEILEIVGVSSSTAFSQSSYLYDFSDNVALLNCCLRMMISMNQKPGILVDRHQRSLRPSFHKSWRFHLRVLHASALFFSATGSLYTDLSSVLPSHFVSFTGSM